MLKKFAEKNSFAKIRIGALNNALMNDDCTIRIHRSGSTNIEIRVEDKDGKLLGAGIHYRLLSALERANNSYDLNVKQILRLREYCLESEKRQLFTDISILSGDTLVIKKNNYSKMLLLEMTNWFEMPILFKSGISLESVLDSAEKTLKSS